MTLDEHDLKEGLRYIVGTWEPDYIVNMFSNDLAHIPAGEFKSEDGTDFTGMKLKFCRDHSMKFVLTSKNTEEEGTWEQVDRSRFRFDVPQLADVPEGPFKEAARELNMADGNLNFAIGFLVISLKKIAEGEVTEVKEPDIGDLEPSEADLAMKEIVGKYETYKSFAVIGDDFGLHTRAEVEAENQKKIAACEMDEDEAKDALQMFDSMIEFTDGHEMKWWMKLPAGISDEEIKAALEEGEIAAVEGDMFLTEVKEWKALGGKYYYNTGEHREVFDEVKSPWDELVLQPDGTMEISEGMMVIRKIS